MPQNEYNDLNESWVEYKQEQMDEVLTAAQEYEHESPQSETNLC